MNATKEGNAPTTDATLGVGWVVVAAFVGFALCGLLGLVSFAALAFVLTGIVGLGVG